MLDNLFAKNTDDLPILVSTAGLFEDGDNRSLFLIEKLQAWFNYQALVSDWYADEANKLELQIVLTPEQYFLDLAKSNNTSQNESHHKSWTSLQMPSIAGLINIEGQNVKLITAISTEDLKDMMEKPSIVESQLQVLLKNIGNYIASEFRLPVIH
jgi:hypothetical protein